jgi:hypothetical protein
MPLPLLSRPPNKMTSSLEFEGDGDGDRMQGAGNPVLMVCVPSVSIMNASSGISSVKFSAALIVSSDLGASIFSTECLMSPTDSLRDMSAMAVSGSLVSDG